MYLNIDAGTMNPVEHGEVFVTHDGLETDQDLGHYERFIDVNLTRDNYMTNGQIYKDILESERSLVFQGKCVEPYYYIPPDIIKRWKKAGEVNKADVVIVELGGTVGEYEGLLFFEAARRIKLRNPKDLVFILVGYMPAPPSIGELKSKPLQQSISTLNSLGIQPDFVIVRAEKRVDKKRKDKIHLSSGVKVEHIISNPDLGSVYEVPLELESQGLASKISAELGLKLTRMDLKRWKSMLAIKTKEDVTIGIVGKYQQTGDYTLSDAYVCVVEALRHAARLNRVNLEVLWINANDLENIEKEKVAEKLSGLDGIIVPQGWGTRGVEGKIRTVEYARKNMIPYLGLCFGMQMAVIEFGRNVLGMDDANSEEVNPKTTHPVVHIMPSQKQYLEKLQYGGTVRLGAWPCLIGKGTKLEEAYKKHGSEKRAPWYMLSYGRKTKNLRRLVVHERHRHRYEFNNKYKRRFEKAGMIVSGYSPDGRLVEAVEIPSHPFFVGTQFHPEYLSRPLRPHPIFISFINASLKKRKTIPGKSL